MIGTKFYLNFLTSVSGTFEINEPIGFKEADHQLIQESGRMGRDVLFSGGEANISFSAMAHPNVFNLIQKEGEIYGFDANVRLTVDFEGKGVIFVVGYLDYFTAKNNTTDLFECKLIVDTKHALLKTREDINTDLFSEESLNENDIIPVETHNILIKAKPLYQVSKWESSENTTSAFTQLQRNPLDTSQILKVRTGANNANVLKQYGIKNTLSFISSQTSLVSANGGIPNLETFTLLDFEENASNLKIEISDISGNSFQTVLNSALPGASVVNSASGIVSIEIRIGFTQETATIYTLYAKNYNYTNTPGSGGTSTATDFPTSFNFTLPFVERNKRVWLYVNSNASAQFSSGSGTTSFYRITGVLNSWKIKATATLTSYSSVNKGVRLIDAIKYNVLSSSGMDVSFPMAEAGGYLYDQFIFNGNLLRSILDKPFYMTFKKIRNWFPELNLDYEVLPNDIVFIGGEPDYYTNNEIDFLDDTVFDDYQKPYNPKFAINDLTYGYKNYQSKKENDTDNTNDGVHGETQWLVRNEKVSNKKEISVEFSRDPFALEDLRRKSLIISENTSTVDDDKIYILDVLPKSMISEDNLIFTETSLLQHSYDNDTSRLTLRNDGSFNFVLLGIEVQTFINIANGQPNSGSYIVVEVQPNYLVLGIVNATASTANNGERFTTYSYYVIVDSLTGINWTNEQFTLIENINNPESYSNLRFTVKRNMLKYNSYLATANLFHRLKNIKNTLYKNNPELITVLNGVQVKEGLDFIPNNPILSPFIEESTFMVDFKKYKELESKMRSNERGFIRCRNAKGHIVRLYPQEMKWNQTAERLGTLKIKGEEKYLSGIINIEYSYGSIININNEYFCEHLRYDFKNQYFYIKDQNGRLLYDRLFYNQISINGSISSNTAELIENLNLMTE